MISPTHVARIGWSNAEHFRKRFVNTTISGFAHDLARAVRLLHRDPPERTVPARAERVIITLSTVPHRVQYLGPVLRSLLDQTEPADRVVLAWPRHSLRTGDPYPHLPALPSGVEVLRCTDLGPATKLLPTLLAEPDAVVVVVDDDAIYPDTFVADLLAGHRVNPKAAVGVRGSRVRFDRDPRYFGHVYGTAVSEATTVDVLMGMWGYLIPPGALDDDVHDFDGWPPEMRWQDDVWISGHLARRDVPRLVIPVRGVPIEAAGAFVGALHHTVNRSGRNEAVALSTFRDRWGPSAESRTKERSGPE
ncbi:hypothetical protein [Nocardia sp. NPDC047654]|uniref:hypothetical protein n=1 Tax=Nocardia sp. NPDC047654 TaxID=3364314 RepID=UPI00371C3D40